LNADGSGFAVLQNLDSISTGARPYGRLLQSTDGNFYSTTYEGGGVNAGTVFRLAFNFNTPPTVACSGASNIDCAPASGVNFNAQATVSDADSCQTLTLTLKEGTVVLGSKQISSPAANQVVGFDAVHLAPGVHTLIFEVSDGSSNASCSSTLTVNADTVPPVPPVLPDVTGQCSATITAVPTATDAC